MASCLVFSTYNSAMTMNSMPIKSLDYSTPDVEVCRKARLARDARFDGLFFVGVVTTGIYCRPICPATSPKESNVRYFFSAIEAANQGLRPCLRCRPDSAPSSPAWNGNLTTFHRAKQLIDDGELQDSSLEHLCDRLGVTTRYLRQLFQKHLGTSPKQYAQYQQCLFAKQLLHQSSMTVSDIALASGFNSIRRFNDCFKKSIGLTPREIRRKSEITKGAVNLQLAYRPPLNWPAMHVFLQKRAIEGLEWTIDDAYGRTINTQHGSGWFELKPHKQTNVLMVRLSLDHWQDLYPTVRNLRRTFDLDADIRTIETSLVSALGESFNLTDGLRLPGIWDPFEAGIRAILGQQVSVKAAQGLVTRLVHQLGKTLDNDRYIFPQAKAVARSDLAFLPIPGRRRQTLNKFAKWYLAQGRDVWSSEDRQSSLLSVPGIGPWTLDYLKLRGLSDPDIWLSGDLGIKNAIKQLDSQVHPDKAQPFRSYLTFQLWQTLS